MNSIPESLPNLKIKILTTGGTIEKVYDEIDGLLLNRGPVVEGVLKQNLRLPYLNIEVISLFSKDSLDITPSDREKVVKTVMHFTERNYPVLVLHGTDTMAETARNCQETCTNLATPVVFTGAMKPLGYLDGDAIQNVTEAIVALQLLPPGVYLSFHGRVFNPKYARKNHSRRTFESTLDT